MGKAEMLAVLLVVSLASSWTEGSLLTKCELKSKLERALEAAEDLIARLVCTVENISSFNTSLVKVTSNAGPLIRPTGAGEVIADEFPDLFPSQRVGTGSPSDLVTEDDFIAVVRSTEVTGGILIQGEPTGTAVTEPASNIPEVEHDGSGEPSGDGSGESPEEQPQRKRKRDSGEETGDGSDESHEDSSGGGSAGSSEQGSNEEMSGDGSEESGDQLVTPTPTPFMLINDNQDNQFQTTPEAINTPPSTDEPFNTDNYETGSTIPGTLQPIATSSFDGNFIEYDSSEGPSEGSGTEPPSQAAWKGLKRRREAAFKFTESTQSTGEFSTITAQDSSYVPQDGPLLYDEGVWRQSDQDFIPRNLYGIFQLSGYVACKSESNYGQNVCGLDCEALIDDDISNDLDCLLTLYKDVSNMTFVDQCLSVTPSAYFAECD